MRNILLASLVGLSLSLSGCVISVDGDGVDGYHADWQDREHKNRSNINKLSVNMSLAEVSARMGVPDFNELHEKDQDSYQVLYFRTQRKDGDGVTTKDECTPLVLKNGELIGWGETANEMIYH
jgi:hypothetical protein